MMFKKIMIIFLPILLLAGLVGCGQKGKQYIEVNMVPKPKEIKGKQNKEGKYLAGSYAPSISTKEESFNGALESFIDYAKRVKDINFTKNNKGTISLELDTSLQAGAYRLDKNKLYASDIEGINNGLASVLQIMKKDGSKVLLPQVTIRDYPDSSHRGMMVDLARDWHDFDYLINYVDMCYFYKLSVLHLHFTDDQSYTLPSEAYPKLPTENRHYTREQLDYLVEYANARGIEIMPEIDIPGHCTPFQQAYPTIFGFSGIIHLHEETFLVLEEIFDELCQIFKYSKFIHIGGDEAAISKWTTCNKCKEYVETKGIDSKISNKKLLSEQMLAHFVSRISDAVFKNGKQPIVWEGFAKEVNDMVSKDIIVMSWENYYQVTPDLLEAGFKIINCSWNPMYVVTAAVSWPLEEVYDWTIYKWKPVHPGSPYINTGGIEIEPNENVLGGQLLAWGDKIEAAYENVEDGVKEEMRLLLERLPALSENTWNKEKQRDYDDFIKDAKPLNETLRKLLKIKD